MERIKYPLFFLEKYVAGIIALRINYASMAENATEKITLCGQTRHTQHRTTTEKTSVSMEKTSPQNAF